MKGQKGLEEWVRVSVMIRQEARQLMGGHGAEMMINKGWDTKSIGVRVL